MESPAIDAKPDLFPKVNWVSVTDKTREPDDMDDRAAKYIEKDNQLLINVDFRVYNDMVDGVVLHRAGCAKSRHGGGARVVRAVASSKQC